MRLRIPSSWRRSQLSGARSTSRSKRRSQSCIDSSPFRPRSPSHYVRIAGCATPRTVTAPSRWTSLRGPDTVGRRPPLTVAAGSDGADVRRWRVGSSRSSSAASVVVAMDPAEDRSAGVRSGGEVQPVDQFDLEGGEGALGDGVVEARSGRLGYILRPKPKTRPLPCHAPANTSAGVTPQARRCSHRGSYIIRRGARTTR